MNFLDEIKNEIMQNNRATRKDIGGPVREAILKRCRGSFSSGYHLEFTYDNVEDARNFCDLLAQHDIFAKLMPQNNHFRVYIKNSDCICNLLALVGANKSLLKLSDQIAMRSVRNVSNRRANCDTANISKQVTTASTQVQQIQQLKNDGVFAGLDVTLQRTANARLENPDASYDELAKILGITKSGLVHRLQKILLCARFN